MNTITQLQLETVSQIPDYNASNMGDTFMKYVNEHFHYPNPFTHDFKIGSVFVSFVVDESGQVTSAKLLNGGISKDVNFELLRLILESSSRWKPALYNNKPIKQRMQYGIYINEENQIFEWNSLDVLSSTDNDSLPVFVIIDNQPSFLGGDENYFREYCKNIIKETYPEITGSFVLEFVINKRGRMRNVSIPKAWRMKDDDQKKVLQSLKNLPLWTPCKQGEEIVNLLFRVVINLDK
ncbi:MAG: hypothetical protein Q7J34_06590 [Bacteroidales bacterium]|nr:hypothetical protein [Bacteroidales bacterium]